MARVKEQELMAALRQTVKAYDEKLYDFCYFMTGGGKQVTDILDKVFGEFSSWFRKNSLKQGAPVSPEASGEFLLQTAYLDIRSRAENAFGGSSLSRDPRRLRAQEEDLFSKYISSEDKSVFLARASEEIVFRLQQLDADFRAPVVLRDIMQLEDEPVLRILGIRWGIYRHRLHRGRMELREVLKGAARERQSLESPLRMADAHE